MEWFEYIIMAVAIFLVLLPLILKIINKKNPNKSSCNCGCSSCSKNCACMDNFKNYLKQNTR